MQRVGPPKTAKLFYKRECQEKYSPAELEASESSLGIQPLRWRRLWRLCSHRQSPPGRLSAGGRAGFHFLPFPLVRMCSSERPGAVKGAPAGAAKRTLDGEDRSATIRQEEKEIGGRRRFLKRRKQSGCVVPTMILFEARGLRLFWVVRGGIRLKQRLGGTGDTHSA